MKRNADWIHPLDNVIRNYNNTIHSSAKITLTQASTEKIQSSVGEKMKGKRKIVRPRIEVGDVVRMPILRDKFSKTDTTN